MEYSFGASQYLSEDTDAQQAHAAGLRARFEGRFPEAYEAFREATAHLRGMDSTLHRSVQSARVYRDMGSTAMLEAVVSDSTTPLADAQGYLELARREGNYVERHEGSFSRGNAVWQQEMLATHARTIGLAGRLATLSAVMFDRDTRNKSEDARYERNVLQRPYGQAHQLFLKGNDNSGLVEHALLGARQERLNGRRLRMLPWLSRAARGLVWTMTANPEDLPNAWAAVGRHLPSLRSYKAAREAVLTNP